MRLTRLLIILMFIFAGCSAGYKSSSSNKESKKEKKIEVTAYSFNARLYQKSKPTSFKLELYQTDSLLGLSGRGYLGKGALKGVITRDSINIYFPASKEYLSESLIDLLQCSDCPNPVANLNILEILSTLPDSINLASELFIESDYSKKNKAAFVITADHCSWRLDLLYDIKKESWRLRKFDFNDGENIRLKGERDRFKVSTKIRPGRYIPEAVPEAIRIRP